MSAIPFVMFTTHFSLPNFRKEMRHANYQSQKFMSNVCCMSGTHETQHLEVTLSLAHVVTEKIIF